MWYRIRPPLQPIVLIAALLLGFSPGTTATDNMACSADQSELHKTVAALIAPGKGILVRPHGPATRHHGTRCTTSGLPPAIAQGSRNATLIHAFCYQRAGRR